MIAWGVPDDRDLGDEISRSRKNALLTLKPDLELAQWFREHAKEIEGLSKLARGLVPQGQSRFFSDTARANEPETPRTLQSEIDALAITGVEVHEDDSIDVVVGGLADNAVIFRHVLDGLLPHISRSGVIWAEALGDGWFLVRTT